MAHPLCVLAAGLLLGQAEEVISQPARPGCNCRSGNSAMTQSHNWTQTGTWTQTTGTWTPATGWTYRTTTSGGAMPSNSMPTASVPNDSMPSGSMQSSGGWLEDRPILSRIFGRGQDSSRGSSGWQPVDGMTNQNAPGSPVYQTGEPPLPQRMSNNKISMSEPPLLEIEPAGPQLNVPNSVRAASFEPAKVVAPAVKIGHEADYSRITGKLVIENGVPIVSYADPSDRFGGRMILSGDMDISHLRSGDVVDVRGTVLQGRTISIYRAQSIELVERK